MKTLSIREVRASLPHLESLLEQEGELLIARRGEPIARLTPLRGQRRMPSRADLRASMPRLGPSEDWIRQDRDER